MSIQNELNSKLVNLLKQLETDSEGYILQNQANRRILAQADSVYFESIDRLEGATQRHLRGIAEINSLNEAYFSTISSGFTANKQFINSLQKQLISDVNTFILQDGLQANFKLPLNDILTRNIQTGGQFEGFLNELRTFIKGDNSNGQLVKHARTWLRDALFNYSRSYQQSVTNDLGLEFYLYAGGLIKDSRNFCVSRAGQYFHHNEIESWAGQTWQGKRVGTTESSIFIYCGGWSCNHSLIPVDVSIVPQEVINRNINSGNYTPK